MGMVEEMEDVDLLGVREVADCLDDIKEARLSYTF